MKKERASLAVKDIFANDGQLAWLPKNPREWGGADVEATIKSIREDPDFLEDRPLLVVPFEETTYIVFAGNLRREGADGAEMKTVPCIIYHPKSKADYATIKRRAMKDNGSFGKWDTKTLREEWGDLPLGDWGVPPIIEETKIDIDGLFNEEQNPSSSESASIQIIIDLPESLSEEKESLCERISEILTDYPGAIIK